MSKITAALLCSLLPLTACSSAPPAPPAPVEASTCPDEAACRTACAGGEKAACVRAEALAPRPEETPAARALRLCDGGAGDACFTAGTMMRDGNGVPADAAGAAKLFERGCTAGDGASCAALAEQVAAGNGVAQDPTRALRLNDQACTKKQPAACSALGRALEGGVGGAADPARAAVAYRAACGLGQGAACFRAGQLAEAGKAPADQAQIFEWYVAGWNAGDKDATLAAARLRLTGTVAFAKENAALEPKLYEDACTAGSTEACVARGWQLRLGNAADVARAAKLGEAACAQGNASGCNLAGLASFDVMGDLRMAEALYGKGCAGGSNEACANQGVILLQCQKPGPCDKKRGRELLQTACAQRIDVACGELAAVLRMGNASDKAAAAALLDRSCELGNAAACYESAVGTKAAEQRRTYLDRGCSLDDQVSCFQLALMLDAGEGGAADPARAEGIMGKQCQPGMKGAWGDACSAWCNEHGAHAFCK